MIRLLPVLPATAPALALSLALAGPGLAQTAPAADAAPADAAPAAQAPAAPAPADASAPPPAPEETPAGQIGGTYVFDPEHSQIVFSYDHMGFSTSRGFVNGVTGTVVLDEADPSKSTVEAQFPLSALHTVAPTLDEHLLSDDFFKGATAETLITFTSTAVTPKGDNEAEVTGDLTMNGVTRPVTLEVELNRAANSPMLGKPAVGFEIEGTLKRSDFGLGAFAPAVSDEVKIEIAVEALKG